MRVLVVEDEARMAELLRRGLTEEGYAVDVSGDGLDGLQLALEHGYAAVVLDQMLPGLPGLEVCRRLRAAGCGAPVLMLTARDGVPDRIRGLDAGADDYLVKPFAFGELTARLRALVRRGAGQASPVLEYGDLRLDPLAHLVTRGDVPIELTATEFSLLELFLRRPGELLTRSRILDEVWDFAYDPSSNVVDQYIGYVRRKVERPWGRTDLETVRGLGYRLRAEPA